MGVSGFEKRLGDSAGPIYMGVCKLGRTLGIYHSLSM